MHILLPPSEAKRRGGRGKPLAARQPSELLARPRAEVSNALAELLAAADRATIAAALALPESAVDAALDDNSRITTAPTMPALDRYSGVVYDGLGAAELSPAARRVANKAVLVFSGLFGVVRGGEPTPPYRVPAKAVLPGLGVVGTYWRRQLAPAMAELVDSGVVIDLRSADYSAMWQPRGAVSDGPSGPGIQVISVRLLSPKPDGSYGVISYPSKYYKGRLAAALLERAATGDGADSADDVLQAWNDLGELDGCVRRVRGKVEVELRTRSATVVGSARQNRRDRS